jgi:hypothetical protein
MVICNLAGKLLSVIVRFVLFGVVYEFLFKIETSAVIFCMVKGYFVDEVSNITVSP